MAQSTKKDLHDRVELDGPFLAEGLELHPARLSAHVPERLVSVFRPDFVDEHVGFPNEPAGTEHCRY